MKKPKPMHSRSNIRGLGLNQEQKILVVISHKTLDGTSCRGSTKSATVPKHTNHGEGKGTVRPASSANLDFSRIGCFLT